MIDKKILLTLLVISLISNISATLPNPDQTKDWKWSDIEVLSSEFVNAAYLPSVAVDSKNNVHVFWYSDEDIAGAGTDFDILYSYYDVSIPKWTEMQVISSESVDSSGQPHAIIDKDDNIHVIWTETIGSDSNIVYKLFNHTTQLWGPVEPVSETALQDRYANMVVDINGDVLVVWEQRPISPPYYESIFFNRRDTVLGWETEELLSIPGSLPSNTPSVAVDNLHNVHVVWNDATNYSNSGLDRDIFYRKWDARTKIWREIEVLSNGSVSASLTTWNNNIATDSDDNVHIVWNEYIGGVDSDVVYRKFNSFNNEWEMLEVVSFDSYNATKFETIAVDNDDTLHVVWEDNSDLMGAGNDRDLFYSRKVEDGEWQRSQFITPIGGESAYSYFSPEIIVDSSYQLHVVWQDDRDFQGVGTNADVFYQSYSTQPDRPILNNINPNPSEGVVELTWEKAYAASTYSIYRDSYPIYDTEGLTKIGETTDTHYVDEIGESGTYYYAITANNQIATILSNTVYVQITKDQQTLTEETTITDTVTEKNNIETTETIIETTTTEVTTTKTESAPLPITFQIIALVLIVNIVRKRSK